MKDFSMVNVALASAIVEQFVELRAKKTKGIITPKETESLELVYLLIEAQVRGSLESFKNKK